MMVADIYASSGMKHSAVVVSDQITHHNYDQFGNVMRARLQKDVIEYALPKWATLR
jgi:hypothetical protein